jgi:hypothetical protein
VLQAMQQQFEQLNLVMGDIHQPRLMLQCISLGMIRSKKKKKKKWLDF